MSPRAHLSRLPRVCSAQFPWSPQTLLCAQRADPLWRTPGFFAHPFPTSGYALLMSGTGQNEACGRKRSQYTAHSHGHPRSTVLPDFSVYPWPLLDGSSPYQGRDTGPPSCSSYSWGQMASHHCWSRCHHPAVVHSAVCSSGMGPFAKSPF